MPETCWVLKITLRELNSFAVRLTSVLWISVLTNLSSSLRLFLIKWRINENLLAVGYDAVFCLGDVAIEFDGSLAPHESCERRVVVWFSAACWEKSCSAIKIAKQRTST